VENIKAAEMPAASAPAATVRLPTSVNLSFIISSLVAKTRPAPF
jgi:hypothetical protein